MSSRFGTSAITLTVMPSLGDTHRTLREAAADEIHALILNGELAPGERLLEDRLAAKLGVSRNPVREAIRLLESTGLVEVIPRRGAYVTKVDVDDLEQLLEMRGVVEGHAAELAAARRSDEDARFLAEVVANGRDATAQGNIVKAAACHREFHMDIERMAGNRYLTEVAEPLRSRTELVFALLLDTRRQLTWSEHEAICDAIAAGDREAARAAVDRHLASVRQVLRDLHA